MSARARVLEVFIEHTDPKTGVATVSDPEVAAYARTSHRWATELIRQLREAGRIEIVGYDASPQRRRQVRVIR